MAVSSATTQVPSDDVGKQSILSRGACGTLCGQNVRWANMFREQVGPGEFLLH